MPSGQRSWRTSAKHLASSNSPERLTRSDAGMIARAPCMKTAAAHHPIRSLARRLPAPLPLITPEANKSLEILYGQRPIGFSRGLANIEFDVSRLLRRNQIET